MIEASLEHNPLATESFDLLTCISLLEHVWNVGQAMGALERLLVRGGHLLLHVPDATRPSDGLTELLRFEHLSYFSPGSLVRLLREFGLSCVELQRTADHGLLLCARKDGRRATLNAPVPDDREPLREAVTRRLRERTALEEGFRRRLRGLRRVWKGEGRRVGFLGADRHTQLLLDLEDVAEHVVAVFDPDVTKQGRRFVRWHVKPPEELDALAVDTLLLSSPAHVPPASSIEIVPCYAERQPA